MKLRLLTVTLLSLGLLSGVVYAEKPTSETDKLSYTIGNDMGAKFKKQDIQVNPQVLAQGLQDALNGATPALTADEQKAVIESFQKQMMEKAQEKYKMESETNAKAGEAFLKANAKKSGVKTTKSGLQYEVIEKGTGAKPTDTDKVNVDYEGTSIDGKVFDSSYERGKPVTFAVNQVVPGWTEALKMMPVGSTWKIYVPAKLGYGEQGVPGAIGPNQVLVFKLHLISIEKPVAETKSEKVEAAPATATTSTAPAKS